MDELRERLLRAGVAPRYVRRYITELTDHLADMTAEAESLGMNQADARAAALLRLGDPEELARAMIHQRQFQSWCVRTPWAIFVVAPLVIVSAVLEIAVFIVQSHLPKPHPGARVSADDLAVFCVQFGMAVYLGAPILLGWVSDSSHSVKD